MALPSISAQLVRRAQTSAFLLELRDNFMYRVARFGSGVTGYTRQFEVAEAPPSGNLHYDPYPHFDEGTFKEGGKKQYTNKVILSDTLNWANYWLKQHDYPMMVGEFRNNSNLILEGHFRYFMEAIAPRPAEDGVLSYLYTSGDAFTPEGGAARADKLLNGGTRVQGTPTASPQKQRYVSLDDILMAKRRFELLPGFRSSGGDLQVSGLVLFVDTYNYEQLLKDAKLADPGVYVRGRSPIITGLVPIVYGVTIMKFPHIAIYATDGNADTTATPTLVSTTTPKTDTKKAGDNIVEAASSADFKSNYVPNNLYRSACFMIYPPWLRGTNIEYDVTSNVDASIPGVRTRIETASMFGRWRKEAVVALVGKPAA